MQEMEIALMYRGSDFEADKALFRQVVEATEARHLPYFIGRPGLFEDDAYEHLHYHFFFFEASGRVILLQAESSLLPPEIVAEVQAAFVNMFGGQAFTE